MYNLKIELTNRNLKLYLSLKLTCSFIYNCDCNKNYKRNHHKYYLNWMQLDITCIKVLKFCKKYL